MNVDWNVGHSLSEGGPPSACACGVSLGRAFPAGVSNTRSIQLCLKIQMDPLLSTSRLGSGHILRKVVV